MKNFKYLLNIEESLLYPIKMLTTSNIFQVDKINMEGGGKKIIQRRFKLEREKNIFLFIVQRSVLF